MNPVIPAPSSSLAPSTPSKASSLYKPVKVITSPPKQAKHPSMNSLANKLRSFRCNVKVPRLKYKLLDEPTTGVNAFKLHEKDIQAYPSLQYVHQPVTPRSNNNNKEQVQQSTPQIPTLKIRLRKPSDHHPSPQNGRSLSSILAEIVRRPHPSQQSSVKSFPEYSLPQKVETQPAVNLFSSSLSKSISAIAKFADTEICRDILTEVLDKIEESNAVCGSLLEELVEDIFFQEECCAHLLDSIVDQVVDDVESVNDMLDKQRIATEEDEFLKNLSEDQKTEANLPDIEPITCAEDDNESSDFSVGLDNEDNEVTNFDSEGSSIELSDSEFDNIGEKSIPIETGKEISVVKNIQNNCPVPNLVIKKSALQMNDNRKPIKKRKGKKKKVKPAAKKVPKLIIKPLLKKEDEKPNIEKEDTLPPIIVKIPKASLSPQKISKSPKKTPEKEPVKLNIKVPKPPPVKSLKILPLSPPEKHISNRNTIVTKESESNISNQSTSLKLTIQTPPPLSVIRNKVPLKSAEESINNVNEKSTDARIQKPTRNLPARMKQKEEKSSALMHFLEIESKRKLEERKKQKVEEPENTLKNKIEAQNQVVVATKSPMKKVTEKYESKAVSTDQQTSNTQLSSSEQDSRPAGVGLQRRNSLQKREQWVTTKTTSPTPPAVSTFVAKKSRPSETVSFSLPPGGFKNQPAEPKSKTLTCQVDELFSQYFPVVNSNLETNSGKLAAEAILDTILTEIVVVMEENNKEDIWNGRTSPGKRKRKRTENLGKCIKQSIILIIVLSSFDCTRNCINKL